MKFEDIKKMLEAFLGCSRMRKSGSILDVIFWLIIIALMTLSIYALFRG